jgi:hypothetical protein
VGFEFVGVEFVGVEFVGVEFVGVGFVCWCGAAGWRGMSWRCSCPASRSSERW